MMLIAKIESRIADSEAIKNAVMQAAIDAEKAVVAITELNVECRRTSTGARQASQGKMQEEDGDNLLSASHSSTWHWKISTLS